MDERKGKGQPYQPRLQTEGQRIAVSASPKGRPLHHLCDYVLSQGYNRCACAAYPQRVYPE